MWRWPRKLHLRQNAKGVKQLATANRPQRVVARPRNWNSLDFGQFVSQLNFFEVSIMKKFVISALVLAASTAFATGPVIEIKGESTQSVSAMMSSVVSNKATSNNATASQNLSSNAGNVTVKDESDQKTTLKNSTVSNKASGGGSVATQSLASNVGVVNINDESKQTVYAKNSIIMNAASGPSSRAVQNLATNNGCLACN
jgi:hypothetical protein